MIKKINISVVDICQTPLKICQWYEKWYKEGEPNSFVVPTNIVLIKM